MPYSQACDRESQSQACNPQLRRQASSNEYVLLRASAARSGQRQAQATILSAASVRGLKQIALTTIPLHKQENVVRNCNEQPQPGPQRAPKMNDSMESVASLPAFVV